MHRLPLLLLTVVTGFTTSPAAQAPERTRLQPIELTLVGICDFDVHYEEIHVHATDLVFVDENGQPTREIVAGNFVTTLTNAETGTALTLNISGQLFITPSADGSLGVAGHGRNILSTVDPEPLLRFQRGVADLTITATAESFELVVNELRGGGFDLCDALAGT